MGRSPCCDEVGVKKGPWTPEEDKKLVDYIQKNGYGSWRNLPKSAGLNRCGKSCRLRWTNYLRPDIKRGKFSDEEERLIIHLHSVLGNKWSAIATRLPGRTDNEIKNYWNTHLRKKLLLMGIDPVTHRRRTDLDLLASLPSLLATANFGNLPASWDNALRMQADAANTARLQIIQTLVQAMNLDTMNLLGSASFGNYQYNDLVQLSRQLEGIANGSLSLPQDAIQTAMALPNMNSLQLPANFQGFCESSHAQEERDIASRLDGSCSSEIIQEFKDGFANQNQTANYLVPTANSTPPLVSAENVTRDNHVTERPISPNSSSSIQFNAWEGQEVGDLDADGWKDVLDQIYWSSAP